MQNIYCIFLKPANNTGQRMLLESYKTHLLQSQQYKGTIVIEDHHALTICNFKGL